MQILIHTLKTGFEEMQYSLTDPPSSDVTLMFYSVVVSFGVLLVVANEYLKRRKK